jgi:hypothetical protein
LLAHFTKKLVSHPIVFDYVLSVKGSSRLVELPFRILTKCLNPGRKLFTCQSVQCLNYLKDKIKNAQNFLTIFRKNHQNFKKIPENNFQSKHKSFVYATCIIKMLTIFVVIVVVAGMKPHFFHKFPA